MQNKSVSSKESFIFKIVIISLIGNIVLTLIKLLFGYLGSSVSLVSDGYNSLVDILVSILILITLKVANKVPDKNHPYGHEKYEGVMYLILSMFVIATSCFILYQGIYNLVLYFKGSQLIKPENYTIWIAIIALVIKFILYYINNKTAKKFNSSSLKADSKNHLFDILATSVSLISLILTGFNILYFEPIATIIISLFIGFAGFEMIVEAISFLVDESPKKEVMKELRQTIISCTGVIAIDDLKARKHMNHFYVDVEIAVDANLSLLDAHKIAEDVHDKVEDKFKAIHCMVHVNPYLKKREG